MELNLLELRQIDKALWNWIADLDQEINDKSATNEPSGYETGMRSKLMALEEKVHLELVRVINS